MKYKNWIIKQIFENDVTYNSFFASIGNYTNPEMPDHFSIKRSSDYYPVYAFLLNSLSGFNSDKEIVVTITGNYDELEKYDLKFKTPSGVSWQSSWTKQGGEYIWTFFIGDETRSFSTKNWDGILSFIKAKIK